MDILVSCLFLESFEGYLGRQVHLNHLRVILIFRPRFVELSHALSQFHLQSRIVALFQAVSQIGLLDFMKPGSKVEEGHCES